MGIRLNEKAQSFIKQLKTDHKARGIKTEDWSEIISEVLINARPDSWIKEISKKTSDHYFMKKALKDEEMKEEILSFIKEKMTKKEPFVKSNSSSFLNDEAPKTPKVILRKSSDLNKSSFEKKQEV